MLWTDLGFVLELASRMRGRLVHAKLVPEGLWH